MPVTFAAYYFVIHHPPACPWRTDVPGERPRPRGLSPAPWPTTVLPLPHRAPQRAPRPRHAPARFPARAPETAREGACAPLASLRWRTPPSFRSFCHSSFPYPCFGSKARRRASPRRLSARTRPKRAVAALTRFHQTSGSRLSSERAPSIILPQLAVPTGVPTPR